MLFAGRTILLAYVIPAALGVALLLALLLAPRARVLLALTIVPAALAALAAEVVLMNFTGSPWRSGTRDADLRSQEEVVDSLRRESPGAVAAMAPRAMQYWKNASHSVFPLAGVSRSTTVFCNESGKYLVYESDQHGFNNSDTTLWSGADLQVAAVGDSYVQGACVSPDSNATSVIGGGGRRTLNLGVWGSGPLSQLAVITEYLPSLKPRRVLFFFFEGNDFNDLAGERDSRVMVAYLDGQVERLTGRQAEIDSVWMTLLSAKTSDSQRRSLGSQARAILRFTRIRAALGLAMTPPYDPLLERVLRRARDVTKSWGGELYLVYLPAHLRYERGVPWGRSAALRSTRRHVLGAAASSGIPVIDVTPAFDSMRERETLWYTSQSHYSPRGYRVVGETVIKSLF